MHALTIDFAHCPDDCELCEQVKQGLLAHCTEHGSLLISGPSTRAQSRTIRRLINGCPNRAITIHPLETQQ